MVTYNNELRRNAFHVLIANMAEIKKEYEVAFLPTQSYSLGNFCDELGIAINGRHRAAGDALATVKLFEILLKKKTQKETKQTPGQLRLF